MGFIAQVFSLFRRLSDVNWASITSSAPFLKWDLATDKIVGAPSPVPVGTTLGTGSRAVADGYGIGDAVVSRLNLPNNSVLLGATDQAGRGGGFWINDQLGGGRTSVTPFFEIMDFSQCSVRNINRFDGTGSGLLFANSLGRIYTEPSCKAHFGAPTFNVNDTTAQVEIHSNPSRPAEPALIVHGAVGQTANILDVRRSDGSSAMVISPYQVNVPDFVAVGLITAAGYSNQLHYGGHFMRDTATIEWRGGPNVFFPSTTRISQPSTGILRVQDVSTSTPVDGGVIQKGVYVDAANLPQATTLGDVVSKIQVFDAAGNPMGYVAVYDEIV